MSALRRPQIQLEVHAVINGPDQDLAAAVASLADSLVVRDQPRGFAANHNDVLRRTTAPFHVIANDDVRVLGDGLGVLVDALQRDDAQRVAVMSPVLLNPDGSLQPSTYSFPTLASAVLSMSGLRDRLPAPVAQALARVFRSKPGTSRMWRHDRVIDVDTLRGAFVLVRRSAVDEVGLMSEVALVGGEEVEWHKRFAEAGWLVRLLPQATVTHVGRVSTGGRPDLEIEYLKGTTNFFRLHSSRLQFELVRSTARVKAWQLVRRARKDGVDGLVLYPPTLAELTITERRK